MRQVVERPQQTFDWRLRAVGAVKHVLAEQLPNNTSTSFEFHHAASFDVVEVLSCATDQQCLSVSDGSDKGSVGQIDPPCGNRFERIWRNLDGYSVATACQAILGEFTGRSISALVFQNAVDHATPGRAVWLKDERPFRSLITRGL